MQIIIWILGVVSAYLLWSNTAWLSIVVILLTLSYEVHNNEKKERETTGVYSNATATRLMWTFVLVAIIFVYSLFK